MRLYRKLIQWHVAGVREIDVNDTGGTALPRIDRVVWESPSGDVIATIDILAKDAWPVVQRAEIIIGAIEAGDAHELTIDPYNSVIPTGEGITLKARERRDRAYEGIKLFVEEKGVVLYDPQGYRVLMAQATVATGRCRRTLIRDLRRWWQRGMTRNALLPDSHKGGGKGKRHRNGEKKRGPKNIHVSKFDKPARESAGKDPNGRAHSGINIDDHARDLIMKGLEQFYEARRPKKPTFANACDQTRNEYFNNGYERKDGLWIPTLPPAHMMPTNKQMRYWYRKERTPAEEYESRHAERELNLLGREVMGDTSEMIAFPGAQWQIDATKPDIWLVSDLDPTVIIGSPVFYSVKDPFARFIAGINVTIGEQSWVGGMEAALNAAEDKVQFCARYGITIEANDWPSHHLPYEYLADGGELKGYDSDQLPDNLEVDINNTGSYRGDLKGVVERDFLQADNELTCNLPGAKPSRIGRGDVDPAKHACLTVREFTRLMIRRVITYNKVHRLEEYPFTQEMVAAMAAGAFRPYPIDIWQWGIVNLGGPKEVTAETLDHLRLALLPTRTASVTEDGLVVDGLRYDSAYGRAQGWFKQARQPRARRMHVPVAIEPRLVNVVYLRLDRGRVASPCFLRERDHAYLGCSWAEVEAAKRATGRERATSLTDEYQERARLDAETKAITKEAEERKRRARTAQRGTTLKKIGRRAAKAEQKVREDSERAWRLARHPASTDPVPMRAPHLHIPPSAAQTPVAPEHRHVRPTVDFDRFARIRDAAWAAPMDNPDNSKEENNDGTSAD